MHVTPVPDNTYRYQPAWSLNSSAYSPPAAINCEWVPCSTTRPSLSTRIRSATRQEPQSMRDQYHGAVFGHTSEMIVHAGLGLGVEA